MGAQPARLGSGEGLAFAPRPRAAAPAADDRLLRPAPSLVRAATNDDERARDAVARLATEVSRLGAALDRRIDVADRRAQEGLAAARAELAALEAALERRLDAAAEGQARALAELRGQVEAAVESLSRRIETAEQTAAGAIGALGERIDRLDAALGASEARLGEALQLGLRRGEQRAEAMAAEMRGDIARQAEQLQTFARAAAEAQARARRRGRMAAGVIGLGAAAVAVVVGLLAVELAAPAPANTARVLWLPALRLRPTLPFEIWPRAAQPAPRRAPTPLPPPPARPAPVPPAADMAALAAAAARGDAAATARVQALAAAGAPPAELLLAKLYEAGQGGLARDPALARQWTTRAAQGGERAAMHNLAVYLINGEGGAIDAPGAALWFRRAAEAGVLDAAYNLAVLYENGRGMPRNLAEAYLWYSIAANAGDGAARGKAVALEPSLTPRERSAVTARVSLFTPGRADGVDDAPPVVPPAATIAQSQQLLSREGYYIGPTDGADSPAYRSAAAAYLRQHPQAAALGAPAA